MRVECSGLSAFLVTTGDGRCVKLLSPNTKYYNEIAASLSAARSFLSEPQAECQRLTSLKRLELECEGGPPVASALVVVCDLAL